MTGLTVRPAVTGQIKRPGFGKRIPARARREFTRELSVLLRARLRLTESLSLLAQQSSSKRLKEILQTIKQRIQSGASLAEAMRVYPAAFDSLLCSMVEVGEMTGSLPEMLARVAAYQQKMAGLQRKFVQAMTYPLLVIAVAAAALSFIVLFVLPTFEGLFREFDAELPWLTRALMQLSAFVNNHIILLLTIIAGAGILLRLAFKQPAVQQWRDRQIIKIPFLGALIRKNLLAQFCRTLGTLLSSGVSLLPALEVAQRTVSNSVMQKEVRQMKRTAGRGGSMSASLRSSGIFPLSLTRIIGVGEETAELPAMLLQVADTYDEELDSAIELLSSVIEPVMIVVLGIIIGVILVSIYLPLFNMSTVIN